MTDTHARPDATQFRLRATWHIGALAVYIALVVYASIYPFLPRLPGSEHLADALRMPRYYTQFDLTVNVLAYLPLGVLAYLQARPLSGSQVVTLIRAAGGASLLSLILESLQLFVVGRVCSWVDVACNSAGALIGASLVANRWGAGLVSALHAARLRFLVAGGAGEVGIALVLLWLLAQLNPAIPFFEAGNIGVALSGAPTADPREAAAEKAWRTLGTLGVAASVTGFGLFIAALIRKPVFRLRIVLVLIATAALAKAIAATAMLKPALALAWVDTTSLSGVVAGVIIFAPLRALPERLRAYLGGLAILAGAMITKAASMYDTIGDLLGLFRWPHGQLTSFTTLTRYIYEAWPLLALVFMVWLFVAPRKR